MNRRTFLQSATTTALAAAAPLLAAAASMPIIDTHIHLFDPTRPGGVPWPEISDKWRPRTAAQTRLVDAAAHSDL